jgi:hypothetical protein
LKIEDLRWRRQHKLLGYGDFFDNRHKRKMLNLAQLRTRDIIYDLGCGDASLLILASKEYEFKKAVGFENNPFRNRVAKRCVRNARLEHKVSIHSDMYDADIYKANVVIDMLTETFDTRFIYNKARTGTKWIKHDLPLIGILADKIDIPFYLMTFPLKKAKEKNEWASHVLQTKHANIDQVWQELYHYSYEKGYKKEDIRKLNRILSTRLRKKANVRVTVVKKLET